MRIHNVERNPEPSHIPIRLEPLEGNYIVFTRIQDSPVCRVNLDWPVKMWDLYLFAIDRILKSNFSIKYKIQSLTHELGVSPNLDVEIEISRLFILLLGLLTESMCRYDIPGLHTGWDLELEIQGLHLF
jgi:hypothetical protein